MTNELDESGYRVGGAPQRSVPVCDHVVSLECIIIIISAYKSDLSSPWSQTQASLSIPSLHPKKQIKEEKERKNIRRESLPRSDRRGGGKIKQEQKQKQRPAKHIRETNK